MWGAASVPGGFSISLHKRHRLCLALFKQGESLTPPLLQSQLLKNLGQNISFNILLVLILNKAYNSCTTLQKKWKISNNDIKGTSQHVLAVEYNFNNLPIKLKILVVVYSVRWIITNNSSASKKTGLSVFNCQQET